MLLDAAVHLTVKDTRYRYNLAGVVYHGRNHFTSRIVKPNGKIWYHDGLLTGSKCVTDGLMSSFDSSYLNSSTDIDGIKRTAVGVIYSLMD
ncbi:hypothetical protein C8F04DRAFT_966400 [Mycena alexandri]|uniref:Uncharacterized protein n=1 Tax=Mycena alexandri TaxID=1745969 RepID=A0AAD6WVM8_9AGAR|nr:hypothetical protein C8F04DRAFT_966446 [Mycena alexandri]KAJ7026405.1 hypothetical protein C8F04DRAFT_966400 [Mycena alexandri]